MNYQFNITKYTLALLTITNTIIIFCSFTLVSKLLSVQEFANYHAILMFTQFLIPFSLSGMLTATTQSVARGFEGSYLQNLLISTKFYCVLSISIIFASVIIFPEGSILFDKLSINKFFIFIILFLCYFTLVLKQWTALLQGRKKFILPLLITIFANGVFLLVCTTLFLLEINSSFTDILLYYFCTQAFFNLIGFIGFRAKNKNIEGNSGKYGISISIAQVPNLIANNIDKFLILSFEAAESFGALVIIEKLTEVLKQIIQRIAATRMPEYAKMTKYKKFNYLGVQYILSCGILVFASWIIFQATEILFPEYEVSWFLALLPLSLILMIPSNDMYNFIRSHFAAREVWVIQILMSAIKILSSLAIVPNYGLNGVILSAFFYRFSMLAIASWTIRKFR